MKLTSPNYPKPYDPLEYCTWNITAPQEHFVTLDFDTIDVSNFELREVSTKHFQCLIYNYAHN